MNRHSTKHRGPLAWSWGWYWVSAGLVGLAQWIWEWTWIRQWSLAVGQETLAMSAILSAIFLHGGIGAWWGGRMVRAGHSSRRATFALVLSSIGGVFSLLLVEFVRRRGGIGITSEISGFTYASSTGLAVGFALAAAVIPLGASFVFQSSWVGRGLPDPRVIRGWYVASTIGGLLGLFGGAWAIGPRWGFSGAIYAGSLALILSAVVWHFGAKRLGNTTNEPSASDDSASKSFGSYAGTALGIGWLSMGYECWAFRQLNTVTSGTLEASTGLLGIYLTSWALGAFAVSLVGRRTNLPKNDDRDLQLRAGEILCVIFSMGFSAAIFPFVANLPSWTSYRSETQVLVGGLGMLMVPGIVSGWIWVRWLSRIPRANHGSALAIQSAGAAIAPWILIHGLYAAFGSGAALGVLVLSSLGLLSWKGMVSPRFASDGQPTTSWWLGTVALGSLLVVGSIRDWWRVPPPAPGMKLIKEAVGANETAGVWESVDGHRLLRVNQRFIMGGTGATGSQKRHALLPLLWHPDPRRILFLGVGTGISFSALRHWPDIESVGIEISPEVESLMPHFVATNLPDPNHTVVLADARRYLRTRAGVDWDVVIGDLFHPDREGAASLYTVEHFSVIRERLRPGGLYCQWLPLFQLDLESTKSIVRTFCEVFPESDSFLLRWHAELPVLGLVGWTRRPSVTESVLSSLVVRGREVEAVRSMLSETGLQNGWAIWGGWWLGGERMRLWAGPGTVSTDNLPTLWYRASELGRRRLPWETWEAMAQWRADHGSGDPGWLELGMTVGPTRARWQNWQGASDRFMRGLISEASRREDVEMLRHFLESIEISGDFTPAYSRLISYATTQRGLKSEQSRQLLVEMDRRRPEILMARELLQFNHLQK